MGLSKRPHEQSLTDRLITAGAAFCGMIGIAVGSTLGGLAAIPAAAAAWGYSLGGWVAGLAGLAAGAAVNFWPIAPRHPQADHTPECGAADSPPPATVPASRKPLTLSHVMGGAGGITGGLVGAFTGAAIGACVAGVVKISEMRQAMLNGELPRDVAARSKGRDGGPFIH